MSTQPPIQYLRRTEIDEASWNRCIDVAENGLIYGYSVYLDTMAGNWDGLIWGNYEYVMPLPWRRKWGVWYLYQPFFTAQLGVFGKELSPGILEAFLTCIPKKFSYWDISLNYKNLFPVQGFGLQQRMNYVLPLQQSYGQLSQKYRENIRRNIRKCSQYGGQVATGIAIDEIIKLARFQPSTVPEFDFLRWKRLYLQLAAKGQAKAYAILSAKGDLLASAAFLFSHNRAYYILVGNHPNGRTLGASHALVDAFIRDHAGQDISLDFEGSDIRSLAFFYSSFGAQPEPYAAIRLNRLPWWLRWAKS